MKEFYDKKTPLLFGFMFSLLASNTAFSTAPIASCPQGSACTNVVQWKTPSKDNNRGSSPYSAVNFS
jgi:hypothetical protein